MSDRQLKQKMQSAATARNTRTVIELLNEVDKETKRAQYEEQRAQASKFPKTASSFRQLSQYSTKKANNATKKIRQIQSKHMRYYLNLMKETRDQVIRAKERNLRSNKSPTEIKQANENLDKRLDMFILNTMMEARDHRLLKGSEFLKRLERYKSTVTHVGGKKKRTKKNKTKKTKKRKQRKQQKNN